MLPSLHFLLAEKTRFSLLFFGNEKSQMNNKGIPGKVFFL
jgi:hypothetical protein